MAKNAPQSSSSPKGNKGNAVEGQEALKQQNGTAAARLASSNGEASIFFTDAEDPDSYSLQNQFAEHLEFRLVKERTTVTPNDAYKALAMSIRDRLIRNWIRTQHQYNEKDVKKVYYLSLEFLMGRLMGSTLLNMGFDGECADIMKQLGYDLEDVKELEHDMGLGNGGLGRLAACFLDSMATLELPAFGYGIRYEYGIFKQGIEFGYQVEYPDNWLAYGSPWEVLREELSFRVKFGGKVESYYDAANRLRFNWRSTDDVMAVAYDIPVPGFRNNTVNNLRLWQARATEDFDFRSFNEGDYLGAVENKFSAETISKVLYPNDNTVAGRALRLKQQYFFVSASLHDIIRAYKLKHTNFAKFADKVAIQLNDTHPTVAIAELMRILLDEENVEWDEAWSITQKTFAYTNHTVLPEALERWSVALFEELLPRHLQIIYEINHRFLQTVIKFYGADSPLISSLSIIQEGDAKYVRMANLAIVGSHSVNGVAALHSQILKDELFADFYRLYPDRFNNKTNGITQRRWLLEANPYLSNLINETIYDDWTTNLFKLRDLEKYADREDVQQRWQVAKQLAKQRLIEQIYIENEYSVRINPDSLFDAQIKRLHEYKRQLLNVLHVITLYNRIKADPEAMHKTMTPRTVLFGAKSAPGYAMAKLIIKLINSVADVVNTDPDVGDLLKVFFLKNYSVSLAQKIIPATELSEQISTAGLEASGTGNMKFQLNGAITIGTMDGANVEIREEVGDDNIFIFGLLSDEVAELRKNYNPWFYYDNNPDLKRVLDMIQHNYFNREEPGIFQPIFNTLTYDGDRYFLLADYASYIEAQDRVAEAYKDKTRWTRMSILNTARSGKFSSDRTIREYADEIWNVKPVKIVG
jgi:starch phosphorylase